ncbi:MAG: NAD-dependent epimerase/dehydratase family protein [Cyclobacteriaceae bacterium]|nr:NAD-dependent epimerase/dehydratase family protein [Cytophagales bacterium]MBX2901278.1 NAD-dependent epimerase/dehydratase family protein [Cyclobacteriaceae bacterium]
MGRTALIAGTTGLIGKELLDLLLADAHYDRVLALSRKPLNPHPKLETIIVNLDEWEKLQNLKADDVFCCLGTTMKQAKTKAAFRKVDFEYPLQLATALKQNGATTFLLVSALGANKSSGIFYNKVKGEVEDAIGSLAFNATHIFRPSLLLGDRNEQRSGEDAAKVFYKFFGFLIPKKYKGVEGAKVARAMQREAKSAKQGLHVYESVQLQNY